MIRHCLNTTRPLLSLSSRIKTKSSLFPLPSSTHFLSSETANQNGEIIRKAKTLLSLSKNCSTIRDAEQLHAHIIKTGFDWNLYVVGKIIIFCAVSEQESMDYAVSIFETIENPDGFLWNTMIRGFGQRNRVEKAFEFHRRMQEKGEATDSFTFCFMLKLCGQLRLVPLGKQLTCSCLKHGLQNHVHVRNTLIHMYGMLKDIQTAQHLFDEMPEPELIAWNTIINSHIRNGYHNQALDLFYNMIQTNIEPDEATILLILSACSSIGALNFGRWIHSSIENTTLSIHNSLIDMYAKCGAIQESYNTFNKMLEKNIVTWNSMILGLAINGHEHEALKLFHQMLDLNLEFPDDVTFLGVLSACSHGGMVENGRRYFKSMIKDYNIKPTIKHYGCMVDILGRAGFVEEAYHMIQTMPMKCNAIVLRTCLAACKIHGKVELGETVRRRLLEVEPDHSSDFSLLANLYANAGQWQDFVRVRKSMEDMGIRKPKAGNSFIW